jgi:hypothetical protein
VRAPELNDGHDNQCPGDDGHGIADEIEGTTGFFDPADADEYSWPPQPGATSYQVARAAAPHAGSWGTDSAGAVRVVSCP